MKINHVLLLLLALKGDEPLSKHKAFNKFSLTKSINTPECLGNKLYTRMLLQLSNRLCNIAVYFFNRPGTIIDRLSHLNEPTVPIPC